jgi:hypothetical protein
MSAAFSVHSIIFTVIRTEYEKVIGCSIAATGCSTIYGAAQEEKERRGEGAGV